MDKRINGSLNELYSCLDDLIKSYRQLLNTVRKEREILTASDLDELNENNRAKETLLFSIQRQEHLRGEVAQKLAKIISLDNEGESGPLRLLDFFKHFETVDKKEADRLESYHQVLELLIQRVKAYNHENEIVVKSALKAVTGAMKELSGVAEDNNVYRKKGELGEGSNQSGRFVSREV